MKLDLLFYLLNHLPNDKILDITKLKAFADNKLNIAKMTISLLYRVDKKTMMVLYRSPEYYTVPVNKENKYQIDY